MTISIDKAGLILLLAVIVDYCLGDPKNWLHPVQVIGWTISSLTQWILDRFDQRWQRKLAGIILGSGIILASSLTGWFVIEIATLIHSWLGMIVAVMLLASCFALTSLRNAAIDVLVPLDAGDLATARLRLSCYVGRDTANLSELEIRRAVLDTVAENATDGVTAPLFYGIIGAFIPGLGSVPLALGYKAASTLDSMIGYRREPYHDLGCFSAQLEDRLTWLPCRLTVLTLALLSRKIQQVWYICHRDGNQDPSPNSGWSESVYAAILGVQLGGTNVYAGEIKQKPLLGDAIEPITSATIYAALQWTRWCFFIWVSIGLLLLVAID